MKFNIITLGCKVNAYESNYISESLESNGFLFCEDLAKCDVIIINTCTVTDTSDKKSLKMVRKVRRENPHAIIAAIGCSVQNNPKVYEDLNLDIVIGNNKKSLLVDIISEYMLTHQKYFFVTKERKLEFENMSIHNFDQVRAYIKVQDGCNNFCSYCIIPFVRGDIRFKKYDICLKEARDLAQRGFKEIVLTGIHTGSYNESGHDLTDLINAISSIEGIMRVRLSSVEITELNDKFLDMLKTNKTFCHHLHIPLQSGSDEILKKMNRKYDTNYFRDKIKKIREIIPDVSITTDVIVGHNYETDELFEKAYNFCKEINFSKIHVFPYSKRTGTASSFMDGEVSENVKKERCKKLIALSENLEKAYYDKFIGQKKDVLIEQIKDGKSIGHTDNYLLVLLNEKLKVNEIYNREIV